MDPESNLAEQLTLARAFLLAWDQGREVTQEDALRLAELVEALDGWVMKGGSLPRRWSAVLTPNRR